MEPICSDDKLESFSKEHFTYINQIFGDQTLREIISEIKPNNTFEFGIEETGEEFENSSHHILINKATKVPVCSVDSGYQNLLINKNDTLCQSYSLLTYFKKPINLDQKQRQLDMIAMYRELLANKTFIAELNELITNKQNRHLWRDYTINKKKYVVMNTQKLLQKIKNVLTKWEKYGYWYFIGEGKCPINKGNRILGGTNKNSKNKSIKKKAITRKLIKKKSVKIR
jgi:hypothetical protein